MYPSYSAVISKVFNGVYQEVSVSNARDEAAVMTTIITVKDNVVEKRVLTAYQGRTTREDVFAADTNGISRQTKWSYSNGTNVVAKYSPSHRVLDIARRRAATEVFETTNRYLNEILQAQTKNVSGSLLLVNIVGNVAIGPSKAYTVASVGPTGSPPPQVSTVSVPGPGGNTKTTSTVTQGNVTTTEWVVTNSDRIPVDHGRTFSNSGDNPGGGSFVQGGSKGFVDGDMSHQRSSSSRASTDGHGAISTQTTVVDTITNPDGSTSKTIQMSSWTTNADGSSTRTDTTVKPDESNEVTTSKTDKAGNTTTETHTYDSNGDQTSSSETPSNDPDEEHPDNNSSTAYPNPDGTDEGPTPRHQGAADRILSSYLGSANAYLGGNPLSPSTAEGSDPPPIAAIAAAVINPGVDDWDPGTTMASGIAATMGLGKHDPDLNPRALVGNVALLTAMTSLNSGLLAATVAASHF